jgi:hypothetical protein
MIETKTINSIITTMTTSSSLSSSSSSNKKKNIEKEFHTNTVNTTNIKTIFINNENNNKKNDTLSVPIILPSPITSESSPSQAMTMTKDKIEQYYHSLFHLFDEIQKETLHLMQTNSFNQFKLSEEYRELIDNGFSISTPNIITAHYHNSKDDVKILSQFSHINSIVSIYT